MIAVLLIAVALAAPAVCATVVVAVASRCEDRRRTLGSPRPRALSQVVARRVLDFRTEEALWPRPHGTATSDDRLSTKPAATLQPAPQPIAPAVSRSRHRKIA